MDELLDGAWDTFWYFLHEFVAGQPITELDSESGSVIGLPVKISPANSWREF